MYYKYWNKIFFFLVIIGLLADPVYTADAPDIRFLFTIDKFYQDKLNTPMGIFIDKERGEIYVADSGRDEVFIFDIKGTPLFKFGKAQGVSNPFDLVVKKERIYLVQVGKQYVEVYNYRGEAVARMAPPEGVPFVPGRLVLDEDGSIYVINKESTNCFIFDDKDKFIGTIGKGLTSIAGVAVSKDRVYLITPFDGRAIQVYDKQGKFIVAFEGLKDKGGTLGLPTSAMIGRDGLLWLVDALGGIVIYDPEGKEITRFGESGMTKGKLFFIVDIDFNVDDMVFILDKGAGRISVFKISK